MKAEPAEKVEPAAKSGPTPVDVATTETPGSEVQAEPDKTLPKEEVASLPAEE